MNEDKQTLKEELEEEVKNIEMNMLRDRCEKLPEITDNEWKVLEIDEDNRLFMEEFILESAQLSPKTLIQYKSALRIFFKWVKENLNNKKFYKITKRDFLRYQNFLIRHGMSSNGIKLKKASVSSMCNYFENYYIGEDERFDKFRNFVKGIEKIAPNVVYKKVLITDEEYELMKTTALEDGKIREYSLLVTAMETGMRGGELRKMKRLEATKTIPEGATYFNTDTIMGKGGNGGKPLEYMINVECLEALKMYNETRNDKSEWMFVTKEGKQMSDGLFETKCRDYFSDIAGRRINEHLFRASCATRALNRGVSEVLVSKYILHHNDLSTLKHYDLRDFADEKNKIFK